MYHPPHIERLRTEVADAPGAELVVAPKTPHDVVAILHHASEKAQVVQVLGGGTDSGYGDPPDPDIVMSTHLLGAVEDWEPEDLTLIVGAGAKVADVESMLAERNQTAVLPEVPGGSTIGGVVASGRSALRRLRLYGMRERILETTVVTGDGRIVRGGGRVVKNVTGYDLPRLQVGAFGSLGVIVSVCFKLWPTPPAGVTIPIDELEQAKAIARPLAVLEDRDGIRVYEWGTPVKVEAMRARLGGGGSDSLDWPADPTDAFRWSLRVPPALTAEAIGRLPEGWDYLAVHGVGDIRAASGNAEGAIELRAWAESRGGALVVVEQPEADPESAFDPWGRPPPALDIQRGLIAQFDPVRIINPGRLPGGL